MKRAIILVIIFLAACSQSPKASEDAIRKALMQYLGTKQGLALDKMDLHIDKVQMQGDRADADVTFNVKGAPTQSMSMRYTLHRASEGWVVDRSDTVTGHPDTRPNQSALPGELPAGHPPINPTQKN